MYFFFKEKKDMISKIPAFPSRTKYYVHVDFHLYDRTIYNALFNKSIVASHDTLAAFSSKENASDVL